MEKLKLLFSGYNEYSPIAIVLMGNFLSKPYGSQHAHLLREKFKELAEIIAGCDRLLIDTQFIIVPGPTDSTFANILPRCVYIALSGASPFTFGLPMSVDEINLFRFPNASVNFLDHRCHRLLLRNL